MMHRTTVSAKTADTTTQVLFTLDEERDRAFERRLYRKCDRRILPILCVLYLCIFLDRINIGNARIQGLEHDLNMQGSDFNIALMVFYVFYIPVGVATNLLMKQFNPRLWLGSMTLGCGVITICEGITHSWAGLVICRLLLGGLEAGFVPGCIYLISSYYERYSLQWRVNIFLSASLIAGAFGGLLAYAIGFMDGLGGYGAWRWIFILEGAATSILAMLGLWLIPDWPEKAAFLDSSELDFVIQRVSFQKDQQPTLPKASVLIRCLQNPNIWCTAFMFFCTVVTSSSLAYFTPTILHQLGWVSTKAQYMSIPIWLNLFITCLCVSTLSDRLRHRSAFIIAGTLVAAAGYAIMLGSSPTATGIRYLAIYLISAGAVSAQPTILTWQANNLMRDQERGIAVAFQVAVGNCGGVLASNIFLTKEAPGFPLGYGVGLGLILTGGLVCTGLLFHLKAKNGYVDRMTGESGARAEDGDRSAGRSRDDVVVAGTYVL